MNNDEKIARAVNEFHSLDYGKFSEKEALTKLASVQEYVRTQDVPVVNITSIYNEIHKYGHYTIKDLTVPPPWKASIMAYEIESETVCLILSGVRDWKEDEDNEIYPIWQTHNPIDWNEVRWTYKNVVFAKGRNPDTGEWVPMHPLWVMDYAVDNDGQLLDIHFRTVSTEDDMNVPLTSEFINPKYAELPFVSHLVALNFMACRNVDVVDTVYESRSERRRMERTGVKVSRITVFPTGKSRRSEKNTIPVGVPLTTVRGHYAHYGDCCPFRHDPKGLLFGRLEGKYWIPQHAIGSEEFGVNVNDYKLKEGD